MLYCKAVDEVVKEYEDESEKLDRIVVVDHFASDKQDDFKNNKLKDGQTRTQRDILRSENSFPQLRSRRRTVIRETE